MTLLGLRNALALLTLTVVIANGNDAVANSNDFRSLSIPAESCQIVERSGTNNGLLTDGTIYTCGEGERSRIMARCPIGLSSVRYSGTGAPVLDKFRIQYS